MEKEKLLRDMEQAILIYRGDDTCYNQLNTFADELAKALKTNRQRVEIFDVGKEGGFHCVGLQTDRCVNACQFSLFIGVVCGYHGNCKHTFQ